MEMQHTAGSNQNTYIGIYKKVCNFKRHIAENELSYNFQAKK